MKINIIIGAVLCSILMNFLWAEDTKKEIDQKFAIFSLKKEYSFPKQDSEDPVANIRAIAEKRKFNWNNVFLFSSGDGIKDVYFILRVEGDGEIKKITSEFTQIINEYIGEHSVVIQDIQMLNDNKPAGVLGN